MNDISKRNFQKNITNSNSNSNINGSDSHKKDDLPIKANSKVFNKLENGNVNYINISLNTNVKRASNLGDIIQQNKTLQENTIFDKSISNSFVNLLYKKNYKKINKANIDDVNNNSDFITKKQNFQDDDCQNSNYLLRILFQKSLRINNSSPMGITCKIHNSKASHGNGITKPNNFNNKKDHQNPINDVSENDVLEYINNNNNKILYKDFNTKKAN